MVGAGISRPLYTGERMQSRVRSFVQGETMTNVKTKDVKPADARKKPHIVAPVRMGFVDAMDGKPYSPEYETAKQWWQQNYNQGRLIAAECKASNIKAKWPANTILPELIRQVSQHVARELQPMPAQ
jgi:hypothetical protein